MCTHSTNYSAHIIESTPDTTKARFFQFSLYFCEWFFFLRVVVVRLLLCCAAFCLTLSHSLPLPFAALLFRQLMYVPFVKRVCERARTRSRSLNSAIDTSFLFSRCVSEQIRGTMNIWHSKVRNERGCLHIFSIFKFISWAAAKKEQKKKKNTQKKKLKISIQIYVKCSIPES